MSRALMTTHLQGYRSKKHYKKVSQGVFDIQDFELIRRDSIAERHNSKNAGGYRGLGSIVQKKPIGSDSERSSFKGS